ncbi:MAG: hypothetical protein EKK54_06180 [Neisseriaceae bacterium]|nr:MAG: hypothetical protein EKK54_06180 [Neisseriaceae bacterium]
MNLRNYLLKSFPLFVVLLLFYIPAQADVSVGFMDDVLNTIKAQTNSFWDTFSTAAVSLYIILVTIELALDTGQEMLKGSNVSKFAGMIIVRFFMMMVWIAIIKDPSIVTSVLNQALALASKAGNVPADLTPSGIAGRGPLIFDVFMYSLKGNTFNILDPTNILYGLLIIFTGMAILILFLLMGLSFFLVKVESTFVISVGVIMLGFLGSTWTSQNGKAYISYIIAVCIKLIVALLLFSITQQMSTQWGTMIANAKDIFAMTNAAIAVLLQSAVLLFLVLQIPALAAGICTGVSTASLTGALAAGGAIMAAGGVLAAGAGNLADGFKSLGNKGMDTGGLDMDTGLPGGGEDSGGGSGGSSSESMSPEATSPEAPGGDSTTSEGGISGGGDSKIDSTQTGSSDRRKGEGMLSKHAGNATRSLKEAEGHTTVQPPSFSSKHSDF